MNQVEAPEERHAVREHVPEVERVVEQHDGERDLDPRGQSQNFQETPTPTLRERREGFGERLLRHTYRDGPGCCDGQVARLSNRLRLDRTSQRPTTLKPHEQPRSA